jgi:site-specific DNA-methyltransferase (adenine-specific)
MNKTKVTYMDADSLIPYANNPRLNDNAVDAVAASIKEFGFKVPIVVDGENVIINGHTWLKAAHKLGLKQVPVIVADDLTPEQVKAFRLADNKTSEFAEWDMDKNENICDLFGGSGSTLIACEQLNRKCYMMELDPHYVDVIIERWENFTGQKAKLLNEV